MLVEDWRIEYNTVRPHSALGYLTPTNYAKTWTTNHPELSYRWTNNRGPVSGPTTSLCWPATPTTSTPRPADPRIVRHQLSSLTLCWPPARGRAEMRAAPARLHLTVSTRRSDRRRLQITPQLAGDRVLVRFRLPLLLLVAVTVYGVVGDWVVPTKPTPSRCC